CRCSPVPWAPRRPPPFPTGPGPTGRAAPATLWPAPAAGHRSTAPGGPASPIRESPTRGGLRVGRTDGRTPGGDRLHRGPHPLPRTGRPHGRPSRTSSGIRPWLATPRSVSSRGRTSRNRPRAPKGSGRYRPGRLGHARRLTGRGFKQVATVEVGTGSGASAGRRHSTGSGFRPAVTAEVGTGQGIPPGRGASRSEGTSRQRRRERGGATVMCGGAAGAGEQRDGEVTSASPYRQGLVRRGAAHRADLDEGGEGGESEVGRAPAPRR